MSNSIFRNYSISIVFIALISFPYINDKMKLVKDIASSENRKMASKPKFDINHLDAYPGKFEKYYNDHFTCRSLLIRYYNLLNVKVFNKSSIPGQLILGNDGWLFMAGNELDTYRGRNPLTESELKSFKKELEYRQKYLNDIGCKFYVTIAPVKANIYTDEMPSGIFRLKKHSWGEQLTEYLDANSKVKPINIYTILRAYRKKELLYYKLDNHWNQFGAFYASNEILKRIHSDFPDISEHTFDEYLVTKRETHSGNIVNMLSDTTIFKDYAIQLKPKSGFKAVNVTPVGYPCVPSFPYPLDYENDKEIKGSKAPKILIISDSFGNNLFPFLADNFSRSVKIFDSWQYKLNEDIVNKEKPDIVLLVVLESDIRNLLGFQSCISNKTHVKK